MRYIQAPACAKAERKPGGISLDEDCEPEKNMRYPIMIEPGDENTAWSVVVPDLPGCYSAGDTLVEAKAAAEEAVAAWIEAALETGNVVPSPSKAQSVLGKCDHKHWLFSHVTVDLTPP